MTKTNFKIPYFAQERSLTCGIAALRMVFGSFGDQTTETELLKLVKLHSFGTFSTDLGYTALKRGYSVQCKTMYLPLLGQLNLTLRTNITLEMLGKIEVPAKAKMTWQSWERYLQAGGILIWDVPTIDQLGSTDIISVNLALIGRYWKHWDSGHYLVINKANNKQAEVLDPESGTYSINNELLLASWTVNAVQSSNYILTIEK